MLCLPAASAQRRATGKQGRRKYAQSLQVRKGCVHQHRGEYNPARCERCPGDRAPDAITIGRRELKQRGKRCAGAQGERSKRAKQRRRHHRSAAGCDRRDDGKDSNRCLERAVIERHRGLVYRSVHARLLLLGQRGQRSAQRGREKGNASLDAGPLLSSPSQATCHRSHAGRRPSSRLRTSRTLEHLRHRFYKRERIACSAAAWRAGSDRTRRGEVSSAGWHRGPATQPDSGQRCFSIPARFRGEAVGSQRSLEVTSVTSRRSTRHSS